MKNLLQRFRSLFSRTATLPREGDAPTARRLDYELGRVGGRTVMLPDDDRPKH